MTPLLGPVLAFTLGALAPAARPVALEVREARPVVSGNMVSAEVALGGLFSPRVRQSLDRALPASLAITVDLWRDRTGWFDQLVESRSALFRIRYDAWGEDFDVARDQEPSSHLGGLDDVRDSLEHPIHIPLVPRSRLTPDHRYYLVVTASLRPLTPDGLREIEVFLGRQSPNATSRPGPLPTGSLARLPGSLLSVIAALSGLGDEIATRRTGDFTPR